MYRLVVFISLIILHYGAEAGITSENGKEQPEFTEPIKNITTLYGTNVDFSCKVKNLGNHRIMWLTKENGRNVFIGINELKITKNPRVSLSLLPLAGSVMESILYIYNVNKEDINNYECALNTDTTLSQIGTLDVVDSDEVRIRSDHNVISITSSQNHHETTTNAPVINTSEYPCDEKCSNSENDNGSTNCMQVDTFWENFRDQVGETFNKLYTCLLRFAKSVFN